jgi:hypothetical protein
MKPEGSFGVHKSPASLPVLSQIQFTAVSFLFFQIHIHILHQFSTRSSNWNPFLRHSHPRPVYSSSLPHARHMIGRISCLRWWTWRVLFLVRLFVLHFINSAFIPYLVYPFINPLTPELNPSAQRWLRDFLLGILLLEPCISLIYARKTNKCPIIHSVY